MPEKFMFEVIYKPLLKNAAFYFLNLKYPVFYFPFLLFTTNAYDVSPIDSPLTFVKSFRYFI